MFGAEYSIEEDIRPRGYARHGEMPCGGSTEVSSRGRLNLAAILQAQRLTPGTRMRLISEGHSLRGTAILRGKPGNSPNLGPRVRPFTSKGLHGM